LHLFQVHKYSKLLPTQFGYTVLEFQTEAPHATASEDLAQGPNMAARAGFEPTTVRT